MESDTARRIRRANEIYEEKIKPLVEPGRVGSVVAIDVDTGEFFVGADPQEAWMKAQAKGPRAALVCRPVGKRPLYRVGAF